MRYIPLHLVDQLERKIVSLSQDKRQTTRRDALGLALGLHGLRVSEVCLCRLSGLDELGATLTPPTIKRGKERSIDLDPSLIDKIMRWRNGSPCPYLLFTAKAGPLFPSHLQRFCRKVTLETFGVEMRFHALRHTFAMRLYAETKDILLVRKLLGHRSVTSTQVYADSTGTIPASLRLKFTPEPSTKNF
jgi:integrase